MLVINPAECIDCGVCVPECPADAIRPESEDLIDWINLNRDYSQKWPVITKKKAPLPEASKFNGEEGKLEKYFKE
jgi:ferredoxin